MPYAETGEREALEPESLFRLYVYVPAATMAKDRANDQEARSPALGPTRLNENPSLWARITLPPTMGASSSLSPMGSSSPTSYPARAAKSKRFSSTVTRDPGGPSNGAYCCCEERQSPATAASQPAANRYVPCRPRRPTKVLSVYCSWL